MPKFRSRRRLLPVFGILWWTHAGVRHACHPGKCGRVGNAVEGICSFFRASCHCRSHCSLAVRFGEVGDGTGGNGAPTILHQHRCWHFVIAHLRRQSQVAAGMAVVLERFCNISEQEMPLKLLPSDLDGQELDARVLPQHRSTQVGTLGVVVCKNRQNLNLGQPPS